MNRLLVFTENYSVPAGGASYIVDLCNGVGPFFDEIVLSSNPDGYAPDTAPRIESPHRSQNVQVWTTNRLGRTLTGMSSRSLLRRIGARFLRWMSAHDSLVFAFNVMVCRYAIRRARPSTVLAFNGGYPAGRSVLSMAVAARRERLPVALCVASMPGPRCDGRLGAWEERMDSLVAESVDVIIVNAHAIAGALAAVRGLPESKMRVVHNALADIEGAYPGPVHGRRRIGCVSRMDRMKGTRFLVQAFALLARGNDSVELMLVGDGPERGNIEQLVRELGIADQVIMTGHYQGDVNELIATFDVYAFPSLWEGLPYSLIEAMRLGRAIVATDVGGVSEAIIHASSGLLVRPESADELFAALSSLIDDERLRESLGAAARARFEREFSLEAMYRAIQGCFSGDELAPR